MKLISQLSEKERERKKEREREKCKLFPSILGQSHLTLKIINSYNQSL